MSVSSFGPIEVTRPTEVTLSSGLRRSSVFTAEGPLLTDVGATIAVSVLSTPGMIAMMERNCAILALEHLPATHATVGFEVCVRHLAGAIAGTECEVRSELTEIIDQRKLRFDVSVVRVERDDQPARLIGTGTHERRVIEVSEHARRSEQTR